VAVTQNTAQTQNSPALAVTTRNSNNRASEMSDAELSDEQPSPPDTDEAEDDNDLETTSSFFTDKSTPLIVVILSIIIGGVLVGIILMTKGAHQTPASKLDSEIQLKIQEDNYSVQNKIELESYVRKYMQMNYSKENIIKACSYVGWDSELVGKIIEKTYLERKDKN
jgi:hypothetical protein